jgi:hypothetical protein
MCRFALDFFCFLKLFVISFRLLLGGFIPISFLKFLFILDLFSFLSCHALVWDCETHVSDGLKLVSRALLIVNGHLREVQKHVLDHTIGLSAVNRDFPRLL